MHGEMFHGEDAAHIPHPDGESYKAPLDHDRIARHHIIIKNIMLDGKEHSHAELEEAIRDAGYEVKDSTVSARQRDLRKPKFGAYNIIRRRVGSGKDGHFVYRLLRAKVFLNRDGTVAKVLGSNGTVIPHDVIQREK